MNSPLLEICGRVEIIHLRERTDRYWRLAKELSHIGIAMTDPRVRIPDAPRPADANGFPSRGIYGNFLSHLDILRRAMLDDLPCAWVLEDDALFRSSLRSEDVQQELCRTIASMPWDFLFPGHALGPELAKLDRGLIYSDLEFKWSHCYMVHKRALPRVVDYLEKVIERPAGHPEGGKMYIDGAYSLFRSQNKDIRTLIANPVLSIQRGSDSSLANGSGPDRRALMKNVTSGARVARDELWRRTGVHWPGYSAS